MARVRSRLALSWLNLHACCVFHSCLKASRPVRNRPTPRQCSARFASSRQHPEDQRNTEPCTGSIPRASARSPAQGPSNPQNTSKLRGLHQRFLTESPSLSCNAHVNQTRQMAQLGMTPCGAQGRYMSFQAASPEWLTKGFQGTSEDSQGSSRFLEGFQEPLEPRQEKLGGP